MIIELYTVNVILGLIFFVLTVISLTDKNRKRYWALPFLALTFLIISGFGAYDIEKTRISTITDNIQYNYLANGNISSTNSTQTYSYATITQTDHTMPWIFWTLAMISFGYILMVVLGVYDGE